MAVTAATTTTDRFGTGRSREELRLVQVASGLLMLLDAHRLTGRLPLAVQVQASRLRHAVKLAVQAEAARTAALPPAPPIAPEKPGGQKSGTPALAQGAEDETRHAEGDPGELAAIRAARELEQLAGDGEAAAAEAMDTLFGVISGIVAAAGSLEEVRTQLVASLPSISTRGLATNFQHLSSMNKLISFSLAR